MLPLAKMPKLDVRVRKLGFADWEAEARDAQGRFALGRGFTRRGAINDARSRYRKKLIPWVHVV